MSGKWFFFFLFDDSPTIDQLKAEMKEMAVRTAAASRREREEAHAAEQIKHFPVEIGDILEFTRDIEGQGFKAEDKGWFCVGVSMDQIFVVGKKFPSSLSNRKLLDLWIETGAVIWTVPRKEWDRRRRSWLILTTNCNIFELQNIWGGEFADSPCRVEEPPAEIEFAELCVGFNQEIADQLHAALVNRSRALCPDELTDPHDRNKDKSVEVIAYRKFFDWGSRGAIEYQTFIRVAEGDGSVYYAPSVELYNAPQEKGELIFFHDVEGPLPKDYSKKYHFKSVGDYQRLTAFWQKPFWDKGANPYTGLKK